MSKQNKRVVLKPLSGFISETRGIIAPTFQGSVFTGRGKTDYVCSNCLHTLLESMDGLPSILNGCVKCRWCETVSDISSLPKYHRPSWQTDILMGNRLWVEKFEGFMPGISLDSDVLEGSGRVMQEFVNLQGGRPDIIYHYTNVGGLIGIISSGRLWATSTSYLNDKNEIYHAKRIIKSEITSFAENGGEISKEIIRRVANNYDDSSIINDYYIVCFCENGDLLSQWRSYSSNGEGFSLGIHSKLIGQSPSSPYIRLRRVIYDELIQRQHVRLILNEIFSLIERAYGQASIASLDQQTILPALCSLISSHLNECSFTFKDSSFAEEKEWRMIFSPQRQDVRFRQSGNLLTPYVPTELGSTDENYPLLPLAEVISGPRLDANLTRNSFRMLAEQADYSLISYRHSVSPYR